MNLLEFSKECNAKLRETSNYDFAKKFVELRGKVFKDYHNGLIISNSHGINYFDNVVKYWDNPIDYLNGYMQEEFDKFCKKNNGKYTLQEYIQKDIDNYSKNKCKDDYEKNFVLILLKNKNEKH